MLPNRNESNASQDNLSAKIANGTARSARGLDGPRRQGGEADIGSGLRDPHLVDPETSRCTLCDASRCGTCGADVDSPLDFLPEPWTQFARALRCGACLPPLPLGGGVVRGLPVQFADHGWDVFGTHLTGGSLLMRPFRLCPEGSSKERTAWLQQNGAVALDVWAEERDPDPAAETLFKRVAGIFADAPDDAWAVEKDGWVRPAEAGEGADA